MLKRSSALLCCFIFISAVAVSILAYPEIFLTFKLSFMTLGDYKIEYFNTSIITHFMAQGGIQLWDYFGQMPYAYLFTTLGTFKFPNMVTACVYMLLSPLSGYKGVLFHHVFAWANLFTLLLLRVVGIFLLLRCFTQKAWMLYAATIIFAVFFCQPGFIIGTFYQSFYGIFMFFIIRFIDRFDLEYLAAAMVFLVISLANSPIHGSYMYLGLHFFILSAMAWTLMYRREEWKALFLAGQHNGRIFLLVLTAGVVILGPYIWMRYIAVSDVEFGISSSRVASLFSINQYFHHLDIEQLDPGQMFSQMLNFAVPTLEFYFCGFMFIFLAAAGVALSPDKRKWILAATIFLVYLIQFPREGLNAGQLAHWLNVLTNPLHTLVRSYGLALTPFLPYLFFPLIVMGVEEIIGIFIRGREFPHSRWKMVLAGMTVFALWSMAGMPGCVKAYIALSWAAATGAGVWAMLDKNIRNRKIALGVLGVLILADVSLAVYQCKLMLKLNLRQPYLMSTYADQGKLGIEFENPTLFPFREYGVFKFNLADSLIQPAIGQTEDYFQFTNFVFDFFWIDGHNPRHKTFSDWVRDPETAAYLGQNHRIIFDAPYAVASSQGMLGHICRAGLANDAVMIDDPSGALKLPADLPLNAVPRQKPAMVFRAWNGKLDEGKVLHDDQDGMVLVSFHLPGDFPDYMATTFYTEDRNALQFSVETLRGWQECRPVQGEFVYPYSFDVAHVNQGMLTAALPRGFSLGGRFQFFYPAGRTEGIASVWKKQFDNLGIDYIMVHNGWLVFQYPFDTKWKIRVDGKDAAYYKVNKSFIGVPLDQGKHVIEMRYAPGSMLRSWLLLSVICTTLGLIILMGLAFRWEDRHD